MAASGNPMTRLADLVIPDSEPDLVGGASASERGGLNEFLLFGTYATAGDGTVTPITPGVRFWDSKTIYIPGCRIRSIMIVITTNFTLATQAKVQLASGRKAATQASGAASSYPDTANEGGLVGAQSNFGAATNPVANTYWITAQEIPQLQWPLEYVGIEIDWGAVPSAGAFYAAFVAASI